MKCECCKEREAHPLYGTRYQVASVNGKENRRSHNIGVFRGVG